ncbi:hypothetical protein GCM10007933_43120 [Zoogloea oryzae]|uniref:Uncharacterized protein n=1 Tax=Zoogloea oryzae TaxID=310767 RepID=A0ABQ6FGN8_9RHOO|nr:hypothetical protein GCM10007933_43120 [Zoogloea oryzae]
MIVKPRSRVAQRDLYLKVIEYRIVAMVKPTFYYSNFIKSKYEL